MSEIFSLIASFSEVRHLPWLTKILAKDVPLQILIGWSGESGGLLNLPPPIRKKKSNGYGFRGELSHLLHICEIKIGVAWTQKDSAKIMIFASVKV
jgi:hypothetical protein